MKNIVILISLWVLAITIVLSITHFLINPTNQPESLKMAESFFIGIAIGAIFRALFEILKD